jgi:4-diphosphocytidyl-2-C-methyl-D-erythritol kinase
MVLFPNAKINLGLNILRKRQDGFHDIETVFYPVPLCDSLEYVYIDSSDSQDDLTNFDVSEVTKLVTAAGKPVYFSISGFPVASDPSNNLLLKTLNLFEANFGLKSGVRIHLHKAIPMGAGLGGGSADAAFFLKQLWLDHNEPCAFEELVQLSADIGSDCPFFLYNKPMFGSGKGEVLTDVKVNLRNLQIVIIKPEISVPTKDAYETVVPVDEPSKLQELLQNTVTLWQKQVINEFENSVFKNYPAIAEIKQKLMDMGAIYTAMSGSGSAVFALFDANTEIDLSPFNDCFRFHKEL